MSNSAPMSIIRKRIIVIFFCKLYNNYKLLIRYLIGTFEWTYDVISAPDIKLNPDDVLDILAKKTKRKIDLQYYSNT
jgi:hypothetical protein